MPWTIKDVPRFRKGLTEKDSRKWVEIANSVRAKCIADGGKEKTCDAMAIKQANGAVSTNMGTYQFQVNAYAIRTEVHQGKRHLVVPVVMMVEGVHNGSNGLVYHSIAELGKFPDSWNGIPVTIQHPEKDGRFVSANSPDVIDSVVVGRVYNAYVDGSKLKGEVWLNKESIKRVSPIAMAYIMQQRPLDVSVGVFTDDEELAGEWNGEAYTAVAHNHRPDHLALLPGGTGACSWEDGCGIRANSELNNNRGGTAMKEKVKELLAMAPSVYTDADKEWLEKMGDAQIQTLIKCASIGADARKELKEGLAEADKKIETLEAENTKLKEDLEKASKDKSNKGGQTVEVNEEQALKVLEAQISDPAKFQKLLSPELRGQFQHGQRLYEAHRQELIGHIATNQAGDVWKEEDLKGLDTDMLQKIADSIPRPVDYSGAGGENYNANPQEVLLPVGVHENYEEKEGK